MRLASLILAATLVAAAALAAAWPAPRAAAATVMVGHAGFDHADLNLLAHSITRPRRGTFGVMRPPGPDSRPRRGRAFARFFRGGRMGAMAALAEAPGQGAAFVAGDLGRRAMRRGQEGAVARFDFAFGRVVALERMTLDLAAIGRFGPRDAVSITLLLDDRPWAERLTLTRAPSALLTAGPATGGAMDAPLVDAGGTPVGASFTPLVLGLAGARAERATVLFEAVMQSRGTAVLLDDITLMAAGAVPLAPSALFLLAGGGALWGAGRQRRRTQPSA